MRLLILFFMKYLFCLLFFSANLFSQSVFTVVDSISKEPLELATVRFLKSDYTSFTNNEGLLQDIPEGESEAEMSYIGYKTKLLDLEAVNDTVFLQRDVAQL